MLVDALSVAFRALSFIGMFQAAGTAIFIALFGRQLMRTRDGLHRLGVMAALVAAPLVLAHYVLEAARMSGEVSGVMDSSLQSLVLHSPMSTALTLRILGLALILVGFLRPGQFQRALLFTGSVLVVVAFTAVGHTSAHPVRIVLAIVLVFHLGVAALWFGALAPLGAISAREPPALAGLIVERFSALALWLVPGLFAAGFLLAAFLLPNAQALTSAYGRLLLVKVAGFALLMGLAALNKWRFGPALVHGEPRVARAFQRSLITEYVLIATILCVTAVLTSFYSPEG